MNNDTAESTSLSNEEQSEIENAAGQMLELLNKRYLSRGQKVLRGVHPKSHGCLNGTLKINDQLAPELQVGLFASPGKEFQAKVRFSNAAALVTPHVMQPPQGYN